MLHELVPTIAYVEKREGGALFIGVIKSESSLVHNLHV